MGAGGTRSSAAPAYPGPALAGVPAGANRRAFQYSGSARHTGVGWQGWRGDLRQEHRSRREAVRRTTRARCRWIDHHTVRSIRCRCRSLWLGGPTSYHLREATGRRNCQMAGGSHARCFAFSAGGAGDVVGRITLRIRGEARARLRADINPSLRDLAEHYAGRWVRRGHVT